MPARVICCQCGFFDADQPGLLRNEHGAFKRPHLVRIEESLPRSTLEKVANAELRAMLAAERRG